MNKLIVTATVDSNASYPTNPYTPKYTDIDGIIEQNILCIDAGASISHLHGVRKIKNYMQSDSRQVPSVDIEGWKEIKDSILKKSKSKPIIQFGSASTRIEEKVKLMKLGPDMMSVAFNAHDEHFHPDPKVDAIDLYSLHTRKELEEYAVAANEHQVKLELEAFQPGSLYNINYIDKLGVLPHPLYTSLFIGWPGGTWMPPTPDSLLYMVRHLPPDANWNVSVMNPEHAWEILSLAISLGGHVRVGYEDNPFLSKDKYAESCHLLVEKIVRIAEELGREIATPDEARKIIGL